MINQEKIIKRTRFTLSLIFALWISLPWYLWGILLPASLRSFKDNLLDVIYSLVFFIPALIIGYFFLFSKFWLNSFIFNQITKFKIFLFELIGNTITGSLIWGIALFGGNLSGAPTGRLGALFGAFLGFIFGLISSTVILVLKRKYQQKSGN